MSHDSRTACSFSVRLCRAYLDHGFILLLLLVRCISTYPQLDAQLIQEALCFLITPSRLYEPLLLSKHLLPLVDGFLSFSPQSLRLVAFLFTVGDLFSSLLFILVEIHEPCAPRPRLGSSVEV